MRHNECWDGCQDHRYSKPRHVSRPQGRTQLLTVLCRGAKSSNKLISNRTLINGLRMQFIATAGWIVRYIGERTRTATAIPTTAV